ncbi:MAG: arginine--tRNA ligase [Chlorobi bacterium]|nr:arginine--tRNA ligase [Chlorobiota bacterium]MCI0717318.1 arginine--tRNA ligase [Chlorobiota bacterium]
MDIKRHIIIKLESALKSLGIDAGQIILERPKDESHGDISTNAAMMYAKKENKNPREFAQSVIEKLFVPDEYVTKVTIAGPGFINFFISDNYYKVKLKEIISSSFLYGRLETNKGKTANIEWVSANPTGPLHAGHGRHISLGKAIANLLEWSGYKVTREYYYNNAGQQMESLAKSVYARYRQIFEPDYQFPSDGYAGEYIYEIANLLEKEHGDKLIDSDNTIFKQAGENWCFKSIRQTLHRLGITHEVFFNESSLYDSGKINETLDEFKKRSLSYEKDGAVWLKTSELIKDKKDAEDKVIVKATGEPTYRMPDMAYHIDKIKRGYNLIVDVFGSDHGDTYREVLAGVQGLGYDTSKIKVIIHQMVTFVQEGKPVKMSKRSDNVYYLDDLLDDVGVDVAQFFFVMRSANTHLEFDVELAREQSEKNPVFYLQYAHARICGILRNANEAFPDYKNSANVNYSLLNNAEEISLLKILSVFPDVVASACSAYEPHKIITYLNEVAENYHKFYHNHRVINADEKELSYARLKLCEASKTVLKNGFDIIGISAPERM